MSLLFHRLSGLIRGFRSATASTHTEATLAGVGLTTRSPTNGRIHIAIPNEFKRRPPSQNLHIAVKQIIIT
jgi:hypothetical protein